jgi:hypothetical protein
MFFNSISRAGRLAATIGVVVLGCSCGDSIAGQKSAVSSNSPRCDQVDPFRCEQDYPDDCKVTTLAGLNLDRPCRGPAVRSYCTGRDDCVEGEWFVQTSYGVTKLAQGCTNAPVAGVRIDQPSEALELARAVSCEEPFGIGDEACRGFSPDECPLDKGCYIQTRQLIDQERNCSLDELVVECLGTNLYVPWKLEPCD